MIAWSLTIDFVGHLVSIVRTTRFRSE